MPLGREVILWASITSSGAYISPLGVTSIFWATYGFSCRRVPSWEGVGVVAACWARQERTRHEVLEGDPFKRYIGVPIKCALIRTPVWALCVVLCFPPGTEETELDPGAVWI